MSLRVVDNKLYTTSGMTTNLDDVSGLLKRGAFIPSVGLNGFPFDNIVSKYEIEENEWLLTFDDGRKATIPYKNLIDLHLIFNFRDNNINLLLFLLKTKQGDCINIPVGVVNHNTIRIPTGLLTNPNIEIDYNVFQKTFGPSGVGICSIDKTKYNEVGLELQKLNQFRQDSEFYNGKGNIALLFVQNRTVKFYNTNGVETPSNQEPLTFNVFYNKCVKPYLSEGTNPNIQIYVKYPQGEPQQIQLSDVSNYIKYKDKPTFQTVAVDASAEADDDDVPITPEYLRPMLDDPSFIEKIKVNIKKLYGDKIKKYNDILVKLPREDPESKDAPNANRINSKEIVQKLIKLANEKIADITNEKIKKDLIDAIEDQENGISSVTGESRKDVRNYLATQIFILSRGYLQFLKSFNNIILTGPAGVGKTKLASVFAYVFSKSGILLTDTIVVSSPKDFIAAYLGQTAIKTTKILMSGLDGTILIDEAYNIMNCTDGVLSESMYGGEAITEIVNFLDKFMGLSIVIVAGYDREIKNCFLKANEGLSRRFPRKLKLIPYTNEELTNIFLKLVFEQDETINMDDSIKNYIFSWISKLRTENPDHFKNQAGDITNLVGMFLKLNIVR